MRGAINEKKRSRRGPRSGRKARGSGRERRAEILEAAKELFLAEGFNRVTTRALAERAGLSQTGLYLYFRTKEEILRAIHDETHEALRIEFDRIAAKPVSAEARLRGLMRSYIDYGLSHPADYQLTFTVGPDALAPIAKDFSRPFAEQEPAARNFLRFRDHLATLAADGVLGSHDPMLVAQLLWFAGHGAVSLLISRRQFPWLDRGVLIDSLEEIFIAGLRAGA
jgi:AcrR family transcriptional regulator